MRYVPQLTPLPAPVSLSRTHAMVGSADAIGQRITYTRGMPGYALRVIDQRDAMALDMPSLSVCICVCVLSVLSVCGNDEVVQRQLALAADQWHKIRTPLR